MLYILEDNPEIRELVLYTLKNAGYSAEGFSDGAAFMAAIRKNLPELVILDIMLPDTDGLKILERLRRDERTHELPVIMLTAKTSELDKVKGFDYGADDYISKPFSLLEFLARVRGLLRRAQKAEATEENFSFGNIELNTSQRAVRVASESVELTYKEYELLYCLLSQPERVFTRDSLMDRVWGADWLGESRTVDMHIKTLRQKLKTGGKLIKTVRNVGYKISL